MRRHSLRVWHAYALFDAAKLALQQATLVQCRADPDQGRGTGKGKAREAGTDDHDLGLETGTTDMNVAEAENGKSCVPMLLFEMH